MAKPTEKGSDDDTGKRPEIEVVFKKGFGSNRLLDREIELVGSILPELLSELLQSDSEE